MIAALLLAVAGFSIWAGLGSTKNQGVALAVGGAFGLFGLLCLLSLVRQALAAKIPETIVELSAEVLVPGQVVHIGLLQRGPAKIKSLRARLLCLQRTTVPIPHAAAGRPSTRLEERILHEEVLMDAKGLQVPPDEVWQETRAFSLAPDAPATGVAGKVEVLWKIEVWGTGHGLASFMHPFPVQVLHAKDSLPRENTTGQDRA